VAGVISSLRRPKGDIC